MKKQGGVDGMIEPKYRKLLHYAHLLCGDEDKARDYLTQCTSFTILENNDISREFEIEILAEIRDRFYEKKKNKSRPPKSSQLELFDGEEWGVDFAPQGHSEHAGAAYGNSMYIAGGVDNMHRFVDRFERIEKVDDCLDYKCFRRASTGMNNFGGLP